MDYKALYDKRKGSVLSLLEKSIKFYANLDDEERTNSLSKLLEDVQNRKFSIVVVGQFSAGKSTFLNALMGEKYLPSFTTETTATINFLRSVKESPTQKPVIIVNYKDGSTEKCEEVTLENIEKYVSTKGDEVAQKILSVEVYLDSQYLNDGVSLVDSPGLNGVLEGHEQITNEQIARSHAAIFMFNAKQPGSKSDFEKLNLLLGRCNSVLIILNQKDLIKEDEQTVEDVVLNLKKSYAKYFNTTQLPEIYPISSYQALVARSSRQLDYNGKFDFTESQKEELLSLSDIEIFEERLLKYLTQGEKSQNELLSPINKVHSFLLETETDTKRRIEELSNTLDTDELRLQISQLKDEEEALCTKLNNSRIEIRNKVSEILRDGEKEIKASASDIKTECLSQIKGAEDLEELKANAQIYTNKIYRKYVQLCDAVLGKVDIRYRELIAEEYNEYASSIEERMTDQQGEKKVEFRKIKLDDGFFGVDLNVDEVLAKRAEILAEIGKAEERLDTLYIDKIRADETARKRKELLSAKSALKNERMEEFQFLGSRPDIKAYKRTEERKQGGVLGFYRWWFTGSSKRKVTVEVYDDYEQREYDNDKRRINDEYQNEIEDIEHQIRCLSSTSSEEVDISIKRLERLKAKKQQELDELEARYQKDKAKTQRAMKRRAEAYVESLIDDIEAENLKKIYEQLRGNKDAMTNALLDVLQLELQNTISRKRKDIELREKQLSSSQEAKDTLIEQLTASIEELQSILTDADSCAAEINNIQIDQIEFA